jgi:hypothetical protein
MMNLSYSSLSNFEEERKRQEIIPPASSNSFFQIGTGKINLYTIRNNVSDYRFRLLTDNGDIHTGPEPFYISGDIVDNDHPYENMIVVRNTKLIIDNYLYISKGKLDVYGELELPENAHITVKESGSVTFHPGSILTIKNKPNITVQHESLITIYGQVNINESQYDLFKKLPNIVIDSAGRINVSNINIDKRRYYSINDYWNELTDKRVNVHTQGEKNTSEGRLGYLWKQGKPLEPSKALSLLIHKGEFPLGDFRLSVVGLANFTYPKMHRISDLVIRKNSTLWIIENYKDFKYIKPELYIGVIMENYGCPGECIVHGKIIANGTNSSIIIDRGGVLRIEEGAEVILQDGAILRSTNNNDNPVLFLNGTLIIDDIAQIQSFNEKNIIIGVNGKIIVLNPNTKEKRLLFTTPIGIKESDLYRLFSNRLDHVEYHISSNTGIGIDTFYNEYFKEMDDWYSGMRLENAIQDRLIIWHEGAFIELYKKITPWVNKDTDLYMLGDLFKAYGSFKEDRLQSVVERLSIAGVCSILFRFILDKEIKEIFLDLTNCRMRDVVVNPIKEIYRLRTNSPGDLFIRNKVGNSLTRTIVHPLSKKIEIDESLTVNFKLP